MRVLQAGVCNTDLELVKGYMNFTGVPGHEFVGVVEQAVGREDLIGRRVAGEINAACGVCETCRANRPTHCPNRTTLGIDRRDGAFADYLALPFENLHPLPDSVSNDQAVFVEPLAAACEILEQVKIRPTDRVAVIGDGKLGLLCAQVVALTGCDLIAVGRHAEKLQILQRRGIATTTDLNADRTGITGYRRRGHRHTERLRSGATAGAPARHDRVEVDVSGRGPAGEFDGHRRRRDHADRFALRAVRAGDSIAGESTDRCGVDDSGALFAE